MNLQQDSPTVKRLILLGGGHSHLAVLRHLAMHPVGGLETILVSRDVDTPYSGALPAYVAGDCQQQDMHIDLRPLCQYAGVRLIQQEVNQVDLKDRRVILEGRPALRFDLLSLNIGSQPNAGEIRGAADHATPIKPIRRFLEVWDSTRVSAVERLRSGAEYRLAIVGGGPASVEFAFSAWHRLIRDSGLKPAHYSALHILLVGADRLLSMHNTRVQESVRGKFQALGIEVMESMRVTEFQRGELLFEDGQRAAADAVFYATGASLPAWPGACGLDTDDQGFILVNDRLQSLSHPFVFASGDAASIQNQSRPKSGVYAVRQGMPLARNLLRYATGRRLLRYKPQKQALALLYTGDHRAIASRGALYMEGRMLWRLKHRIDSSFINRHRRFPDRRSKPDLAPGLADTATATQLKAHAIRCAGCAAKLGGRQLSGVLAGLNGFVRDDVVTPFGVVEDAAAINIAVDRVLLQTVDFLPAFTRDPWLFARIATNHCLGDIHAMGVLPHSALVIAGIPFAARHFMEETFNELMQGCVQTLNQESVALIGGHTLESAQLGFGLSVNGFGRPQELLPKAKVMAGDALILCKGLGTGTLLAADMQHRARGSWISAAFDSMLISNRRAAELMARHQASAATDVTGFGLAGHLLEMLTPHRACAEILMDALPDLAGAISCMQDGIYSSLDAENRLARDFIANDMAFHKHPAYGLLFDPQTAGGLLASIPAGRAEACVNALILAGYHDSRLIGHITSVSGPAPTILLR